MKLPAIGLNISKTLYKRFLETSGSCPTSDSIKAFKYLSGHFSRELPQLFTDNAPLSSVFLPAYTKLLSQDDQAFPKKLLRELFPKHNVVEISEIKASPLPQKNMKYAHGKYVDEILGKRSTRQTPKDWQLNRDDPSAVFSNPESKLDSDLCNMMSDDARRKYEQTENMHYVIEAFFQRVDMLHGVLTDERVFNTAPTDKETNLHDGGGLYLVIEPDGTKLWEMEYPSSADGHSTVFSLGDYPHVELTAARRKHCAIARFFTTHQMNSELVGLVQLVLDKHDLVELLLQNKMNATDPQNDKSTLNSELLHRIENLSKKINEAASQLGLQKEISKLQVQIDSDEEPDIPIPKWMAQLISDKFKKYHSKRILDKTSYSLDDAFGLAGKKRREEFDSTYVDTITAVNKAREIQWYFNLNFSTALTFAIQLLHNGNADSLQFTHADHSSICKEESRSNSQYPSYSEWCESKGYNLLANQSLRNEFLKYLESTDQNVKNEIEQAMKNPRKRNINVNVNQ